MPGDRGWAAAEGQLQSAILSATRYPTGSAEVLGSAVYVHLAISDRTLAHAARAARELAANAVVVAVERSIATNPRLATSREVSVVTVHPEEAHGLLGSTHTEDVMGFTQGPNLKFYRDVL